MQEQLSNEENYGSVSQDLNRFQAPTSFKNEFEFIGKSSVPMIITFFLQYSLTAVSIFSVGHIGRTELAAVSLATMTFSITLSVLSGMVTCLDTLCSQAYGAGNYKLVGMHWQRCTMMVLFTSLPVNLIWWNSASVLNLIVDDSVLTQKAQLYLRIISLGSPGYIFFETGKRFLQSQGIFNAAQYVLFICTPLNAMMNYLFVWNRHIGIGYAGAPLATAINYYLMAFFLLLYILFIDGKKCWNGFHFKESLENWKPMMSLALPGVIMVATERLAFQFITLSASRLGTETLAAQSITSTIASLTFQIPFGISVAGSTRIANYIGSQNSSNAKEAIKVSLSLSIIIGTIVSAFIIIFQNQIVTSFTNDQVVVDLVYQVIKVLAMNQLYDCLNITAAGCLRGQGRQNIGGNLNLVCYYFVAIPVSLYLAFVKNYQLQGLWLGLGVGMFILALSETYYLFNANWDKILLECSRRNKAT